MASQICVDASFALKLVLYEPDSDSAEAEWQTWLEARVEVITPFLFVYETSSVLRNRAYRKELTQREAEEALNLLAGLGIVYVHPPVIWQSAWELALRFNRPTVYDSFYLALAQLQDCPFWTGDKRLFNTVRKELRWVNLVGTS